MNAAALVPDEHETLHWRTASPPQMVHAPTLEVDMHRVVFTRAASPSVQSPATGGSDIELHHVDFALVQPMPQYSGPVPLARTVSSAAVAASSSSQLQCDDPCTAQPVNRQLEKLEGMLAELAEARVRAEELGELAVARARAYQLKVAADAAFQANRDTAAVGYVNERMNKWAGQHEDPPSPTSEMITKEVRAHLRSRAEAEGEVAMGTAMLLPDPTVERSSAESPGSCSVQSDPR